MSKEPTHNHDDEPVVEVEEFETTDEEGVSLSTEQKLKNLRDKLKIAEAAKRDLHEELQRTKADYLNSRKRLEVQQQEAIKRSEDTFVAALLPLADSFYMAMKDETAWNAVEESWRKGVEGINQQLQRILTSHHVTPMVPLGETFDPQKHEAVATTPHGGDADTILEVVQIGYERDGDVLRPAKVIISTEQT